MYEQESVSWELLSNGERLHSLHILKSERLSSKRRNWILVETCYERGSDYLEGVHKLLRGVVGSAICIKN